MGTKSFLAAAAAGAAILLTQTTSVAGIDWRNDVRASLEEAEGRGVPLLVYLSRDD